jgi:hypothetical protein
MIGTSFNSDKTAPYHIINFSQLSSPLMIYALTYSAQKYR